MPDEPDDLSSGEVVRRFFASTGASEMAAWTHPDARLHPLSRPGRSVYFGPAGVVEMLADMRQVLGGFRIECDEVDEQPEGRVVAHGRLVLDDGTTFQRVCDLQVRDGLVVSFDPEDADDAS